MAWGAKSGVKVQVIKGEKGDKGDTGERGEQGERGLQGEQGIQGIQGVPGEKGEKGDRGEQGYQGVPGNDGAPGAKGDKGDKGDKGEQGIQGIQGIQGEPGTPGVSDGEISVLKSGDTANATVNLADAVDLAFPVVANGIYMIEGFIVWDTSATTVGIKLSATAPASPTKFAGHFITDAANGTPDSSSFNANNVTVTTSSSAFTAGNLAALHAVLVNGVNAGNFQVRFAAETTGTVTIKAGSCLRYRKLN